MQPDKAWLAMTVVWRGGMADGNLTMTVCQGGGGGGGSSVGCAGGGVVDGVSEAHCEGQDGRA